MKLCGRSGWVRVVVLWKWDEGCEYLRENELEWNGKIMIGDWGELDMWD